MVMVTTIDLVRHADVENPANVFYGRLPRFGLSELGRRQAATTAALLGAEPIRAIYTSPLLRARQTAAIIAAAHPGRPPLHQTRHLMEIRSSWQGRPAHELEAIDYRFFDYPGDGDETIPEVFHRLERLIQSLQRRHRGGHIICVSHADPIAIARVGLLGMPLVIGSIRGQPDYPAKGSISRLTLRNGQLPQLRYLVPEGHRV